VRLLAAILTAVAAGCAAPVPEHPLHGEVGTAMHRLRGNIAGMVGPAAPGRLAGPDRRPLVLDLRDALARLPATLRLDVPPFADYHVGVRLAEAPGTWQRRTTLTRALARIRL
jgi:hypothetical protein